MRPNDQCSPVALDAKSCASLCDALMPEGPRREFGGIDLSATAHLAEHENRSLSELDPNKSLTNQPLAPDTFNIQPNYVQATTDFGIVRRVAQHRMEGATRAAEVHGTHTLPACFKMAEGLLGEPLQKIEILRHQISAPLYRNLEMVAYTEKGCDFGERGPSLLFCHLRCNETEVFIRGYKTEKPVVYVFNDSIIPEFSGSDFRDISPQPLASIRRYQEKLAPLSPSSYPDISSNPAVTSLLTLDLSSLFGKSIIRLPELGLMERSIAPFVGRVQNFSCPDSTLLFQDDLMIYANLDLDQAGSVKGNRMIPIDFQMHGGGKMAQGRVTVAFVPFGRG